MSSALVDLNSLLEAVVASGWELPPDWKLLPEHKRKHWLALREGIAPPTGVEKYTPGQLADWLTHQVQRRQRLHNTRQLIQRRLEQEKELVLPPIAPFTPETVWDPGKPKYILRCVYGPLQGLALSRIVALNYDSQYLQPRCKIRIYEDSPEYGMQFVDHRGQPSGVRHIPSDVVGSCADSFQRGDQWGPKMFIWQLLYAASILGGDCVIYFPHNDVQMRLNPQEFAVWIREAAKDPVGALTEPLKLLECRDVEAEDHDRNP